MATSRTSPPLLNVQSAPLIGLSCTSPANVRVALGLYSPTSIPLTARIEDADQRQKELDAAVNEFGSIGALLASAQETSFLRLQLEQDRQQIVELTKQLDDQDVELRISREKIQTLTGLLAANKDQYDQLYAKQMWIPQSTQLTESGSECDGKCTTKSSIGTDSIDSIDSMIERSISDRNPLKLLEQNKKLQEKVSRLERDLVEIRTEHEESQRMSRGLSKEIEEVNARRNSLHHRNVRLQSDLHHVHHQKVTAIQDIAAILDEEYRARRSSTIKFGKSFAMRSTSSFLGNLEIVDDYDISSDHMPQLSPSRFHSDSREGTPMTPTSMSRSVF